MQPDPFVRTTLKQHFPVKQIVTLHYFEFSKDYVFEGERHDFWEFLYVDKGEAEVLADTTGYKLKQGDMIFHKPKQFHSVWANRTIAPNLIVVTFVCRSPGMSFFEDKIFSLDDTQRETLGKILKFGFAAFLPPFDDPHFNRLRRREDAPPGTEQLIKLHLELLLLSLFQGGERLARRASRLSTATKHRSEEDLVKRMCAYLEERVREPLRLDHICKAFNLSKSHAHAIFGERTGMGIMKYFRNLKVEHAKRLIREQQHTFTEIAEMLQYSSVHNFSRHFKSATDMSPSEYARTVMAKMG